MDTQVLITPKTDKPEKLRSYAFKIFHLALSMGLMCFGYLTVIAFQTQLNKTVGSIGITSNYVVFAISCSFAPKIVGCLGLKKAMAIFSMGYVLLALANLYPVAYLFIPVNVLVGFTGAIFWCAEASYLGKLAMNQSKEIFESVTSYYNGIMFCFVESFTAMGNASASFILTFLDRNYLYIILASVILVGAFTITLMGEPTVNKHDMKMSSLEDLEPRPSDAASFLQTMHLIQKSKEMRLIIFPSFYAGVCKSFVLADFSKFVGGYIVGVEKSGYIICGYFIMGAIANIVTGKLVSTCIKRQGLFIVDFIMHMTLYILLLLPHNDSSLTSFAKCYILTALLACGNGVAISQPISIVQSFYLNDKDRTSGVSNTLMSQTLGMSVVFMISIFVDRPERFWIKLVFMIICQVISTTCIYYCNFFVKPIDGTKPETKETIASIGGSFFSNLSAEQIGEFMIPTIAEEDFFNIAE